MVTSSHIPGIDGCPAQPTDRSTAPREDIAIASLPKDRDDEEVQPRADPEEENRHPMEGVVETGQDKLLVAASRSAEGVKSICGVGDVYYTAA